MEPKDFDAERTASSNGAEQQTFVVGGERFTVRRFVAAEVLAEFGRRDVKNYDETLAAYDTFIKQCLEAGEEEKWDKVRKEADPPLTVGAVESVLWWLMEVAAGRPIEASSSSRRGRATPAAT